MAAEVGTRRSTTSRVIAMAKTASLKNSTRSNSRFPALIMSPLSGHASQAAQPARPGTARPGTGHLLTGRLGSGRPGSGRSPAVMSSLATSTGPGVSTAPLRRGWARQRNYRAADQDAPDRPGPHRLGLHRHGPDQHDPNGHGPD